MSIVNEIIYVQCVINSEGAIYHNGRFLGYMIKDIDIKGARDSDLLPFRTGDPDNLRNFNCEACEG